MFSRVEGFLTSPYTGLAVACLLVVVAWKINVAWANLLLIVALVCAPVSAYRVMPSDWSVISRVLSTTLFAFVVGLILYATLWTQSETTGPNYSYGLVLEQIQPGLDLKNPTNMLELRLIFRNAAGAPLKYIVERLEQQIEGHVVITTGRPAVIAKDGTVTYFPGAGFSGKLYTAFEERTSGALTYSALYGHPDRSYSRHATKRLRLDVFKGNTQIDINWIIEAETDEPIPR